MVGRRALAALAPAAMLLVDPWGWFSFGPLKWLATTVLLLGGAALHLRDHPVRVPRGLGLALAALVAWMAGAAAVGLDPTYAWVGTPERHLGAVGWALLALALVVGTSLTEADLPTILSGLVVAGLGVGATATAEALGWEPDVFRAGGRLTATFGSPAFLGAATALLLPMMAGVAADAGLARRLRRAAGASIPLLLVASAGSGARAAWVGLVIAVLVVAALRRRVLLEHRRAVGGVLSVAAVMALILITVTPVGGRLASLDDPDAPGRPRAGRRVAGGGSCRGGPPRHRRRPRGVPDRLRRRRGRGLRARPRPGPAA